MISDHASFLHVGPGQVFVIPVEEWEELEVNIHVYEGGYLILPPAFTCYNIFIVVRYIEVECVKIQRVGGGRGGGGGGLYSPLNRVGVCH